MVKKVIAFDLDGTLIDFESREVLADISDIKSLAKDYTLALVTGSPRQEALEALQAMDILDLFDKNLIITQDDTDGGKSTGEPFLVLKQRIRTALVFIGDSDADQIGCKKAELSFIRIHNTSNPDEKLRSAIANAREVLREY